MNKSKFSCLSCISWSILFAVWCSTAFAGGGSSFYLTYTNSGLVKIEAAQAGNETYASAAVTNAVKVWSLSTNNGPLAGGNAVTVNCGAIGNGSDITNITVGGVGILLEPSAQGVDFVTFEMPVQVTAGVKDIVIYSTSEGATPLSNAYTYNPAGSIAAVTPASGSAGGGFEVVITGVDLCNGGDVTNVTLCGSDVAGIVSQSATQVVVTAGAGSVGLGDVVVYSTGFGQTTDDNAFEYLAVPEMLVLGTNGAAVANGAAPSLASGTKFHKMLFGSAAVTNTLSITNNGTVVLTLQAAALSDDTHFQVAGVPATVQGGTVSNFTVAYDPQAVGDHAAVLYLTNDATGVYTVNLAGAACQVIPGNGPLYGGNSVMVTNGALGNGSDIYKVTVGGLEASITAQGASWVTFTAASNESVGVKDVVVHSLSEGVATLPGAYTVNSRGAIEGRVGERWMDYRVNFFGAATTTGYDPNRNIRYPTNTAADGVGRWTYYAYDLVGNQYIQLISTNGVTNGVYLAAFDYNNNYAIDGIKVEPVGWISQIAATNFVYDTLTATTNRVVITNLLGSCYQVDFFGGYGGAGNVYNFNSRLFAGLWSSGDSMEAGSWGTNASVWQNPVGGGYYMYASNAAWYADRYVTWSNVAPIDKAITLAQWKGSGGSIYNFLNAMRISGWEPDGTSLPAVSPTNSPIDGGIEVVIRGSNLCDGTVGDVLWVTLCGVTATVQSATSTQIVVVAGAAVSALPAGDVRVMSESRGLAALEGVFNYLPRPVTFDLLGVNGATMDNGAAASQPLGTLVSGVTPLHSVTSVLTLANNGAETLEIASWTKTGDGEASFTLTGLPSEVSAGGRSNIAVVFTPAMVGVLTAAVTAVNSSTNTPFVLYLEVDAGGGGIGQMTVLGTNGESLTSGAPVSSANGTDFGAINWQAPVTNVFSITNSGGVTLLISSWQTNGPGAAAFVAGGLSSVSAGTVSNFTVVFDPPGAGPFEAWISIANSDESPFIMHVAGTGLTAGIEVTGDGNFGSVLTGRSSNRVFSVTNSGVLALHITGWTTNGTGASSFSVEDAPDTVEAGTASNFVIRFTPASDGANAASLVFGSDAASGNYAFNVSGSGLAEPRFVLLGTNGAAIGSGAAVSTAYGTDAGLKHVGGTDVRQFMITNAGSAALVVSDSQLTGDGAASFAIQPSQFDLPAGSATSLTVTISPVSSGMHTATVTMTYNVLGGSYILNLAATGFDPRIAVLGTNGAVIQSGSAATQAAGSDFGHILAGVSLTNTFAVTNSGTETLTLTGFEISDSRFRISDFPASVDAGGVSNFTVRFSPTEPGDYAASLRITNNALSQVYTVNVAGASFVISTNRGPVAGGNSVTVSNGHFGTVTNVLVGPTFLSASLVESHADWFTIVLPAATSAGSVDFTVQTDGGNVRLPNAYFYNPAGMIAGVAPSSGSWTGGYEVVIAGTNLCDGVDVTNVTLAGVAAQITGTSATQIWVVAGASSSGSVAGEVRVFSTSFGETVLENGFTYLAARMDVSGATNFGYVLAGSVATNRLSITNAGSETLALAGFGISDSRFQISDFPGTIEAGSASNFTATFTPDGAGDFTAMLVFTNNTTNGTFVIGFSGAGYVISTNRGPFAGGNSVTVSNGHFGTIQNVTVGGVQALLGDHGDNWFAITLPRANAAGLKDIVVQTDGEAATLAGAYIYNPAGAITDVTPDSGTWHGGFFVTISGENLSDGSDVTSVTLCGVSTTNWTVQGATQVVAWADVCAAGALTGDVRVTSVSFGETVWSGFAYIAARLVALGTNGASIGSGDVVSPLNGTRFRHIPLGAALTNTFAITNAGNEELQIAGFGISDVRFQISDLPEAVAAESASNFTVRFTPDAAGDFATALVMTNNSTNAVFTLNLAGACYVISTNNGPFAGGNTVTVSNGHFGTITNVLVGPTFLSATLAEVHSNWFSLDMPAATSAGLQDFIVQTSDNGDITLAGAYTYNPAGAITSVTPPTGSWTGGCPVVIEGTDLASGNDVLSVTLCGVTATVQSASATQIDVLAGAHSGSVTGDVRVMSVSHGETVLSNGFLYTAARQVVLGTNGALIADGASAIPENGTQFRYIPLGASQTNTFAITNAGNEDLVISGFEISDLRFEIADLPPVVDIGGVSNFTVTFTPDAAGEFAAVLAMTNNAPTPVFTLNLAGACFVISTNRGPFAGGNSVTVSNGNFGEISKVIVGGNDAENLMQPDTNYFTITMPTANSAGLKDIVVQHALGEITLSDAYTYNPVGEILSVTPDQGPMQGGFDVVIVGENLANGADVTSVSLMGISATNWTVSGATQIVVAAEAAPAPGIGDVRVVSVSHGETVASNAFAYTEPGMLILGTNGAVIESGADVSSLNGSIFPMLGPDETYTNVFAITNNGSGTLTISGYDVSGPADFYVEELPETIEAGGVSNLQVIFMPVSAGYQSASIVISNDAAAGDYILNLAGAGFGILPDNGPFHGGNNVTIQAGLLGDGTDITNVTVGGAWAKIIEQGTDWVTFTVQDGNTAGLKDVVVQSVSVGATTFSGVYTINPKGVISGYTVSGKAWMSSGQAQVRGFTNAVGANNTIYSLYYYNGILYAGGAFTNIGGSNCFRIAKWDGTNWTSMAGGVAKAANVNSVFANWYGVFAGGYFTNIGGTNAWAVARWDGTNWHAMGRTPPSGVDVPDKRGLYFTKNINGYVNFIAPFTGATVVAGGYFTNTDYRVGGMHYIAQYDGTAFTNMQQGLGNVPLTAAYDPNRKFLYVGGPITNVRGSPLSLSFITRWNGNHWTNLGKGLGNRPTCMAVDPASGELYIGGWFTNYNDDAGNKWPANYIAKWDPVSQSFTNVGSGFNNWVYAIAIGPSGEVYAAGSFTNTWLAPQRNPSAPVRGVQRIAMWDGTYWTNLSSGMSDSVLSLAVNTNNGDLFAGGFFRVAGGSNCWYVARWGEGGGGAASSGVTPSSGSGAGGYQITITGTNLCDGSDVTNVTICGASVTNIAFQSSTQIVVWAGPALVGGLGDVIVYSTGYGETVSEDSFTYNTPMLKILGTNGAEIADETTALPANGTKFPHLALGASRVHTFRITNAGNEELQIEGWQISDGRFQISDLPASVEVGGVSNFTVTFTADGSGDFPASVLITNSSPGGVFTLNLAGSCFAASTNRGPYAGGNTITITNGNFGGITNVLVGPTFLSDTPSLYGTNWFTITLPFLGLTGAVDITVQSWDIGNTLLAGAYTFNPAGSISSITPASGSWTGGYLVVIRGSNLGNGADITNVTLGGVSAAGIGAQSATQVVVTTGAASVPGMGDVRIFSTSHGETVKSNAFTYTGPGMTVLGANGAVLADGSAASTSAGTDFSHRRLGVVLTNMLAICNTGDELLNISGHGLSDPRFEIVNMPDQIAAGATSQFLVVFSAEALGDFSASLVISNDSPTAAYTVNLAGAAYELSAYDGPYAGGNTLTITNGALGNGSDISKVKIGSVQATITAQGVGWVTVIVPGQQRIGAVDIEITSDSLGVSRLPNAYSYNAPGMIFGADDWTKWQEVAGLPAARDQLAAGVLNDTMYAIGGHDGVAAQTNVYFYNGYEWLEVAGLPSARYGIGCAEYSGALHVPGGFNASSNGVNTDHVFDGTTWQAGSAFIQLGAYALGRASDGKLFVAGGQITQSGNSCPEVYRYDGSWGVVLNQYTSLPATLPYAQHGFAASDQDGALFFFGGYARQGDNLSVKSQVYRFDGLSHFEYHSELPAPRGGLAAATLDDKLYAIGGFNNNRPWTNVWRFDGVVWAEAPGLPAARHAHAASVVDGAIYAIGGNDGTAAVTNVFRYPATETGVTPVSGSVLGGYQVSISGANLCDGSLGDVTNVTVCGVSVSSVVSASSTQVVVVAAEGVAGLGEVRIYSARYGQTIRGGAFTYIATPEIAVLGTNGAAVESGSAPVLAAGNDFGTLFVGESAMHTFMITNSGDTTLTFSWTTNGAGAEYFAIETTSGVPHHTSAPMSVRFAPGAVGTHTASVFMANNSTNTPFILNLAGTMIDPRIALVGANGQAYPDNEPASMAVGTDFGMIATSDVTQVTLAITNSGQTELVISGYSLTGQGADAFSVSNLPATVASGASEDFQIYFSPSVLGVYAPVLTLTNNTTGMVFRVNAAGLGARAGEIGLNRSKLTFSATYGGADPAGEAYAITNRGDLTFSYTNTVSYGAGADWLTLSRYDGSLTSGALHQTTGSVSIAGLNAGTYVATNSISSPTAANSPVDLLVELTVGKASQTITFPNPGAQLTTNVTALGATASSGLPVSYAVVSGSAFITNDTSVAYTGAGTVVIRASQAGDGNRLAAPDATQSFEVAKSAALVTLTNLAQTYTGAGRTVGTATAPEGLTVVITYDGQSFAPSDAGSYAVTGVVDNVMWQGFDAGTLVVSKADQAITNFTPTNGSVFITTNAVALEATTDSGLPAAYAVVAGPGSVSGGVLTFSGSGPVYVEASQAGDVNWNTAIPVTNAYVVDKAMADLTLGQLNQVYDGTGKSVSVKRNPSDIAVVTTYNGVTNLPMNAGAYAVTSVVNDVMYQGSVTGILVIGQGSQTITFPNPGEQVTTNRTPLSASADSGLPMQFAVLSGPAALSDGSNVTYTTSGTVSILATNAGNVNWLAASATQSYVVVKTPQATLVFTPSSPQIHGTTQALEVAGGSGTGAAFFAISEGPDYGQILGETNLLITSGTGQVVVLAGRLEDDIYADATTFATVRCARASQTITFGPIDDQHLTNRLGLAATASSGLGVSYQVIVGAAQITDVTNLAFSGLGVVRVVASQEGDFNYNAAPSVTNSFSVYAGSFHVLDADGTPIPSDNAPDWALGTDFGAVPTNETHAVQFLLTNSSASRVTRLTGVTTNGTGAFSISNMPPELAAGAVATATVHFAPLSLGLNEATFVIANDTTNNPYRLNVSGAGVVPGEIELGAAQITWTAVYGGTNPVMQTFRVGNTGGVDIAYNMNVQYAPEATNWLTLNATNGAIPAIGSLGFTGTAVAAGFNVGTYTATNIITSTNAINSPQQIWLRLVVNKAAQTIDFASIPDQEATNRLGLAAEASSGLPVSFAVVAGSPATLSDGTNLVFTGMGEVRVAASQAGNANWNAAPVVTNVFQVTKVTAGITFGNTNQTYTAIVREVSVTTDPAGLATVVTYDGSEDAPFDAGTYEVVATINDSYYQGVKTGTLTVAQAAQTITFQNPGAQITTNITVLRATSGSGLAVSFEVVSGAAILSGSTNLTYTNAGAVAVRALQGGNANWQAAPAVTQSFEVAKVPASVSLGSLSHTYDGTGKQAAAQTSPEGLAVVLAYAGSTNWPVNAGSYAVVGTIQDAIYQGTGTGSLTIATADQTITFGAIANQFWTNRVGLTASASSGLAVSFGMVSGPAAIAGATNLTFSGYGQVRIAASQAGNTNWNAAPSVTNSFYAVGPLFALFGTNNAAIESGSTANLAAGTDFGSALVGMETMTNIFTIRNNGNATLTIAAVATNGPQPSSFILHPFPSAISASSAVQLPVVFAPQTGGSNAASFTFTFDGTNSPFTLNVAGFGLGGGIAFETNELVFSATYQGANPPAQAMVMTNAGSSAFTWAGSVSAAWLAVLPTNGTVSLGGAARLTNAVDIAGLNAGTYTATNVIASPDATNSPQAYTVTLVVDKASQGIGFANPGAQQTTNVTPISATATSGLPVTFEVVSGPALLAGATSPTTLTYSNSGVVVIRALQGGDSNWYAAVAVTQSFAVSKTPQAALVFAPASPQVYQTTNALSTTGGSGTGAVSYAVLSGAGSIVGGTSLAITSGTGSVVVVATKASDDLYSATAATAVVACAKANQAITFAAIGDQFWTNRLTLGATASSGLGVGFAVTAGPASISGGNELTMTGYGAVTVRASQSGDDNYNAAPDVDRAFSALGPIMLLRGTNGAAIGSGNAASLADGTDFGPAIIGMQMLTNVFTLTNSGSATLTIAAIATNGPQPSSFILHPFPSAISASSAVQLPVVFAPQTGGSNAASFTFTFDGTNSPFTLNVAGFGLGGGIAFETNELVFSATYQGANPPAQAMVMTNAGSSAFTWAGSVSAAWLAVLPTNGTVSLGGAARLTNAVDIAGLNAGTYTATNMIASPDATNSPQAYTVTLVVDKASQGIGFANPGAQQTTNVTPISATATSGLPVTFEVVSGPALLAGATSPTTLTYSNSGVVVIRALQGGDSNWYAAVAVTQSFAVSKTPQAALVFAPASPQVYQTTNALSTTGGSGTGAVSYAVLSGAGSIVGGTSLAITSGTGSVVVVATKASDDLYSATAATAVVACAKANQAITFAAIGDQFWTNRLTLGATASSGLGVGFAVAAGPASISGGNELTMTGYGAVTVRASQSGDDNYNAAPDVDRAFSALGPIMLLRGTNGAAIGSGNAASLADGTDFGPAIIGMQMLTNVFTLTNSGSATLTIAAIATNGPQPSSFILHPFPSAISASSAVQLPVVFAPQTGGSNAASFTFTFDGTNSPFTLNVAGFGLGGGIAFETNELVFSATYQGANPPAQAMVMTNAGSSAFTWAGSVSAAWLAVLPTNGTVSLGGAARLTNAVDIAGLNAGTYTATNMIASPDATNSPQAYTVTLVVDKASQGIGFANPGAQQTTNVTPISATATSGLPVTFEVVSGPALLAGATSPTTLTYSNSGVVVIRVLQGGDSNWYAAVAVTQSFAVSKTPQAALVFAPASPQVYQTTNALSTTGGSGTGAVSYAVLSGAGSIVGGTSLAITSGTGSVVVVATKASDDLYSATAATAVVVCAKANQAITFAAIGDQFWTNRLTLGATASSGLGVGFAVTAGPASISGGNELTMTGYGAVTVRASQSGDDNYNAAPDVDRAFSALGPIMLLRGTNGAAIGSGNAASLADGTDFGPAIIGMQMLTNVFTLTNSGSATLTIAAVATNGPQPSSFNLHPFPSAISASSAVNFSVAFDPQTGGSNAASFTFTFDGTNSPFTLNVAGFGLGGCMALETNTLAFLGYFNGNNPPSQDMGLTNTGLSGFSWTNIITYGPGASNWLAVAPSGGALPLNGACHLANAVDLTGIDFGTYTANVRLVSADATNSPQAYAVILMVDKYPGMANPTASNVMSTTAWLGAEITATNYSSATQRGFVWATNAGFASSNAAVIMESGSFGEGTYSLAATNLPAGTMVFFRGWARNDAGMNLTDETNFLTRPPAVVMHAASNIQDLSFDISWSAARGATEYWLDASYDDPSFGAAALVPGYSNRWVGGELMASVTNLIRACTSVWVRVAAGNTTGAGPWSEPGQTDLQRTFTNIAAGLQITMLATRTNYWEGLVYVDFLFSNSPTANNLLSAPYFFSAPSNRLYYLARPDGTAPDGNPHVDITAQFQAKLGGALMRPGDWVAVTNIPFYFRFLQSQHVQGKLWANQRGAWLPPVAADQSIRLQYGVTNYAGQLAVQSESRPPLLYELALAPTSGAATVLADGAFTYAPLAGYKGNDEFLFRVTNPDGVDTGRVDMVIWRRGVNTWLLILLDK